MRATEGDFFEWSLLERVNERGGLGTEAHVARVLSVSL